MDNKPTHLIIPIKDIADIYKMNKAGAGKLKDDYSVGFREGKMDLIEDLKIRYKQISLSSESIEAIAEKEFPIMMLNTGRTLVGGKYDEDYNSLSRKAYITALTNLIK